MYMYDICHTLNKDLVELDIQPKICYHSLMPCKIIKLHFNFANVGRFQDFHSKV